MPTTEMMASSALSALVSSSRPAETRWPAAGSCRTWTAALGRVGRRVGRRTGRPWYWVVVMSSSSRVVMLWPARRRPAGTGVGVWLISTSDSRSWSVTWVSVRVPCSMGPGAKWLGPL